jgi:hypothetical protein
MKKNFCKYKIGKYKRFLNNEVFTIKKFLQVFFLISRKKERKLLIHLVHYLLKVKIERNGISNLGSGAGMLATEEKPATAEMLETLRTSNSSRNASNNRGC